MLHSSSLDPPSTLLLPFIESLPLIYNHNASEVVGQVLNCVPIKLY
jgi:hypothetical protein